MTAAEILAAKDAIKQLVLSLDESKRAGLRPIATAIIDIRRTLRASRKPAVR